jgi:signal transduction histidine kinase
MKSILLSLFLLTSLNSQTIKPLLLPEGKLDIVNFPIQYYIDTNNTLSFAEIKKQPFNEMTSKKTLGYHKKKSVWFRFALKNANDIDKEVYIYHKEAYKSRHVSFFRLENDILIEKVDFSKKEEIYKREIQDSSPTYKITLKAHSSNTIYIKNISRNSYLLNIQLLDHDTHQKAHLIKNSLYAFLFGILIALAIYNGILFISIRHSEYLYYVIFISGSISYLLYISGVPLEYFSINEDSYTKLLYGVSILQAALITFTRKVLETKERLPRVDKVLALITLLPLTLLFIGFFFGIDKTLPVQALVALIAAVTLLVVGIIALKHRIPIARYYLLPVGSYLLFALIGIFAYFGILPYNELTRNAFYFASLSEVFLLSFLLSNRIGILRTNAIESEKRLNSEIQSRNEVLNFRVIERTKELYDLNVSLETKIKDAVGEIRKKDEDLLRQSRMAMMGEMLSMIAHQWRQPLSTIVSIKSTMEIQISLDKLDKERLLKQLQDIDSYAQFMSKTVDDFSGFFKPNKKKQTFMLDQLSDTAILMMQNSYDKEKVTVTKDYKLTKPLNSFHNELLQVFLNILKNANDIFTEVVVDKPTMHVTIREYGDRQTISFQDNAGGIPLSVIDHVFEPYFSTKEERNGTGLGLYMSKTIIEEHCEGTITVSNEGDGALFVITFFFDDSTAQIVG